MRMRLCSWMMASAAILVTVFISASRQLAWILNAAAARLVLRHDHGPDTSYHVQFNRDLPIRLCPVLVFCLLHGEIELEDERLTMTLNDGFGVDAHTTPEISSPFVFTEADLLLPCACACA